MFQGGVFLSVPWQGFPEHFLPRVHTSCLELTWFSSVNMLHYSIFNWDKLWQIANFWLSEQCFPFWHSFQRRKYFQEGDKNTFENAIGKQNRFLQILLFSKSTPSGALYFIIKAISSAGEFVFISKALMRSKLFVSLYFISCTKICFPS